VEVDGATGRTISHVFRGSVRVQTVSTKGASDAKTLHVDETVCVEAKNRESVIVTISPDRVPNFVRKVTKPLVKTLDLVDVVAGGNGFSGRSNRGIDPCTGKCHDDFLKPVLRVEDYGRGDRKYHRVTDRPGIDGVFIPDGSQGVLVVDSVGHTFGDFPPTSNETSGYIWGGGVIQMDPPFKTIHTILDGVDYATSDHRVLYLASNQGITFDLDALRRANPDCTIARFCSAAGNVETASEKGDAVYADIWVLVDGQVRFRRREISSLNGAFSITIPLTKNDHFLTLATTDGGNGIFWDQIIYGDPRLELTVVEPTKAKSPAATSGGERR
jgi:hypothetical protein